MSTSDLNRERSLRGMTQPPSDWRTSLKDPTAESPAVPREEGTRASQLPPPPVADVVVCDLPLVAIMESPYQPRQRPIARKDVEELMKLISTGGQHDPIIVTPASDEHPGMYYVHSGHRRCAALRFLSATTVKAV